MSAFEKMRMSVKNSTMTHSVHNVGRRKKRILFKCISRTLCYFKMLCVSNVMETWMRNTTETDYMITCNHVSADGQFDSDASVPAGAVHSKRLSEGEKIMFYCITLIFVSCIGIILCMFAVMRVYI